MIWGWDWLYWAGAVAVASLLFYLGYRLFERILFPGGDDES